MNIAYDFERTTQEGIKPYLVRKCMRDYGADEKLGGEMADIILLYSVSRVRAGLMASNMLRGERPNCWKKHTYSIVDYDE
jgi:hypothetical protein